ncbi:MAG: DUF3794 domain-containing protein [Ruminococcaceae bacterium]|nr:DUF3794 domain-containing protein [Oscillospiraceae bacterium]
MDINLKRESYKILQTVKDNSIEECVEADFSLPEYMPEILRIIKSVAQPKVNSCKAVGERVTVDGECELRMIYTAEDGCIYSFTQSRPFTRHCENNVFNNATDINCEASVSYVNCRATSTKRAEIKAGIVIKINAFLEETEEIISIEDACIERKCVPVRAMSLGCKKTRSFSMSDTVSLSAPCAFIVTSRASAVCTEIKKISNKIMVKGDAVVEICYVNANDKSCTESIRHTLPINQILEFDGMEESFTGNVTLNVTALDVMLKNEQDGVGGSFDIGISIDASALMWEEKELVVINDAYAVGSCVDLKKQSMLFFTPLDEIRDTYIFREDFQVSGEGISKVMGSTCELTNVTAKKENELLIVSANLSLSVLIKDASGSISNINKILDVKYERKADYEDVDIFCLPKLNVFSLDCAAKGNNDIDVRAEINVSASVFGKLYIDGVTDITESENQPVRNSNAITVYFPEESESLWSIARRYNTTVNAIAEENGLEGETTENLKVVFIPAV